MEALSNCKFCKGKGWVWVPNGPDDVDPDPCRCTDEEYRKHYDNKTVDSRNKSE